MALFGKRAFAAVREGSRGDIILCWVGPQTQPQAKAHPRAHPVLPLETHSTKLPTIPQPLVTAGQGDLTQKTPRELLAPDSHSIPPLVFAGMTQASPVVSFCLLGLPYPSTADRGAEGGRVLKTAEVCFLTVWGLDV